MNKSPIGFKSGAMARAVPGLFRIIPRNQATHVRATGRNGVGYFFAVLGCYIEAFVD